MMAAMNCTTVLKRLILGSALLWLSTMLSNPIPQDGCSPAQVRIRDIMSTLAGSSAWAAGSTNTQDSGADSKLKAALQKRLLVPNVADLDRTADARPLAGGYRTYHHG